MKRLLAILATLGLAVALAPSPAEAGTGDPKIELLAVCRAQWEACQQTCEPAAGWDCEPLVCPEGWSWDWRLCGCVADCETPPYCY